MAWRVELLVAQASNAACTVVKLPVPSLATVYLKQELTVDVGVRVGVRVGVDVADEPPHWMSVKVAPALARTCDSTVEAASMTRL
jgi:hypothetical protein